MDLAFKQDYVSLIISMVFYYLLKHHSNNILEYVIV